MVLNDSESTYLVDIPDFKNYFLMNFSKQDYESPTTAVLELRVEGFICQSTGAWDESITPGSLWGGDVDL